jgi:hypothetical protein
VTVNFNLILVVNTLSRRLNRIMPQE